MGLIQKAIKFEVSPLGWKMTRLFLMLPNLLFPIQI